MPETRYGVRNWIFCEKGSAIDYCVKHNISFEEIHQYEQKTVAETEKETGINYGCFPCLLLQSGKCKGAKPGSFYYPSECYCFECEEYDYEACEVWNE